MGGGSLSLGEGIHNDVDMWKHAMSHLPSLLSIIKRHQSLYSSLLITALELPTWGILSTAIQGLHLSPLSPGCFEVYGCQGLLHTYLAHASSLELVTTMSRLSK